MRTSQIRIRYGSGIAPWVFLAVAMSSNAKADYHQGVEAYKRSDYQRALTEVRPLAEIGDPNSQFLLSLMYAEGKGVTRNDTLAYGWMKLAADAGIPQAITQEQKLSEILLPESRAAALRLLADYSPEGINQRLMPRIIPNCDYQGATRPVLLQESTRSAVRTGYPIDAARRGIEGQVTVEIAIAADGSIRETRIISAIPPGVFDDAVRRLTRAYRFQPAMRDGKPVSAIVTLTTDFQLSNAGDNSDYSRADAYVEKLHKHAEEGDPAAAYVYAVVINGLPRYRRPWSESLPWIQKAASSGLKEAQFQLGQSLWMGRGCAVDRDKAINWLKRSAAQGSAEAQVSLARILMHSGGNEPDKPLFWLQQPAAANDVNGKKYLAAFLAATPNESLRDPKRALVLANELIRGDREDPLLVEIRAAAHAALGEFTAAAADEQTAMQAAKSLKWDTADMAARFASYQGSQPWFGELIPM